MNNIIYHLTMWLTLAFCIFFLTVANSFAYSKWNEYTQSYDECWVYNGYEWCEDSTGFTSKRLLGASTITVEVCGDDPENDGCNCLGDGCRDKGIGGDSPITNNMGGGGKSHTANPGSDTHNKLTSEFLSNDPTVYNKITFHTSEGDKEVWQVGGSPTNSKTGSPINKTAVANKMKENMPGGTTQSDKIPGLLNGDEQTIPDGPVNFNDDTGWKQCAARTNPDGSLQQASMSCNNGNHVPTSTGYYVWNGRYMWDDPAQNWCIYNIYVCASVPAPEGYEDNPSTEKKYTDANDPDFDPSVMNKSLDDLTKSGVDWKMSPSSNPGATDKPVFEDDATGVSTGIDGGSNYYTDDQGKSYEVDSGTASSMRDQGSSTVTNPGSNYYSDKEAKADEQIIAGIQNTNALTSQTNNYLQSMNERLQEIKDQLAANGEGDDGDGDGDDGAGDDESNSTETTDDYPWLGEYTEVNGTLDGVPQELTEYDGTFDTSYDASEYDTDTQTFFDQWITLVPFADQLSGISVTASGSPTIDLPIHTGGINVNYSVNMGEIAPYFQTLGNILLFFCTLTAIRRAFLKN